MSNTEFLHDMLVVAGILVVCVAVGLPMAGVGMRIMDRYQSGRSAFLVLVGFLMAALVVSGGITYVVVCTGLLT
jgi:hypothetical protein